MRLTADFYHRDALHVAPDLIGKILVCTNAPARGYAITEVEAYQGTEDQASHARFGKTSRNAVMYQRGGRVYVFLIYGMYWMLNVVTGPENEPQAVLIRGLEGLDGPGKLTRVLGIDGSFYSEDLETSGRLWIEDSHDAPAILQTPRRGIDYAGEPWKSKPWRFIRAPLPRTS